MILMPAAGFETVMGFESWREFKGWHEAAVRNFKRVRGIE
jgi:hypothetical protein